MSMGICPKCLTEFEHVNVLEPEVECHPHDGDIGVCQACKTLIKFNETGWQLATIQDFANLDIFEKQQVAIAGCVIGDLTGVRPHIIIEKAETKH